MESRLNAYLNSDGVAKIQTEGEAHRAYLEQLREARAARGVCPAVVPSRTMDEALDAVARKQADRRFTGAPLTGFGALL